MSGLCALTVIVYNGSICYSKFNSTSTTGNCFRASFQYYIMKGLVCVLKSNTSTFSGKESSVNVSNTDLIAFTTPRQTVFVRIIVPWLFEWTLLTTNVVNFIMMLTDSPYCFFNACYTAYIFPDGSSKMSLHFQNLLFLPPSPILFTCLPLCLKVRFHFSYSVM